MRNQLFHPKTSPLKGGAESHATCPPRQQQEDQGWQSDLMMPKKPGQQPAQQSEIQQHTRRYPLQKSVVARVPWESYRPEKVGTRKKFSGTRPRNAFSVPTENANAVAMALAEAGMNNFEEITDDDLCASFFSFPSRAEKEVAAELIAEQFAQEIFSGKGLWKGWRPAG